MMYEISYANSGRVAIVLMGIFAGLCGAVAGAVVAAAVCWVERRLR